jgi:purine nucleosidase/pyrimidine-specific ribonucleoside hydrolase
MSTPTFAIPTAAQPLKVILDTDIGDDIDDALALALIIASPELELLGVTTVFDNTEARARQARSLLVTAGGRHTRVPVAAGCGATISQRPPDGRGRAAYLAGTLPNQDHACLPEAQLPPADPRHGVDFLVETIMGGAGDIVPITIGAMTNLAMALIKEPRIAARIPRVVAMACEFKSGATEWNIRCDPEAAAIVYGSGIPVVTTTAEMGIIAQFQEPHLARLRAGTGALARMLAATVDPWCERHRARPSLFDPFAVATILRPQLATAWRRGNIAIETRGEAAYGYNMFRDDAAGPHWVTWAAQRDPVLDFYLERVLAHGVATAAAAR